MKKSGIGTLPIPLFLEGRTLPKFRYDKDSSVKRPLLEVRPPNGISKESQMTIEIF